MNRFKGLKFSILGDSVSALEYSIPYGYTPFYGRKIEHETDVKKESDMWWGMVLEHFESKLLENNSWSGSLVCRMPGTISESCASCPKRTSLLGNSDETPDVILIYMGTNDIGYAIQYDYFETSYRQMLTRIKYNYPNAEIFCIDIPKRTKKNWPDYPFAEYKSDNRKKYCNIIRKVAEECGCVHVNLYDGDAYEVFDYVHPTRKGMETIAKGVIAALNNSKGKE